MMSLFETNFKAQTISIKDSFIKYLIDIVIQYLMVAINCLINFVVLLSP